MISEWRYQHHHCPHLLAVLVLLLVASLKTSRVVGRAIRLVMDFEECTATTEAYVPLTRKNHPGSSCVLLMNSGRGSWVVSRDCCNNSYSVVM